MASGATSKGARGGVAARLPPIDYTTLALRCPVCNTEFTSEIPNVAEATGRDTDLRPRYSAVDPCATLIHTCPKCQYTAYQDGYGTSLGEEAFEGGGAARPGDRPPQRFAAPEDEDLDDLRRYIRRGDLARGVAEGREAYGAERYILGARVWEFLRDDEPCGAADYFLRGSWCARSLGAGELERRCQRDAIRRLQSAVDQSLVPDADKARTLYLLGELSRRAGDFAKAVDLFSQLEANADPEEEEAALFAYLAKRQLALAIVKSDINAVIAEEEVGLERDEEA
jgi:uncharacterized protein (DUF2225 family)